MNAKRKTIIAITVLAALAMALNLPGCGRPLDSFDRPADGGGPDADSDGGPGDGSLADAGPDAAQGPFFIIHIEGDLTPKTITDGLSGQTPSQYRLWIGRFELMRSSTDPDPALVFEHGADYAEADMLSGRWEIGRGRAADVPNGTYTHARVVLIAARVTIDATLHFMSTSTPGQMEIFGALSDCTLDEVSYNQGDAVYTFNAQTVPGTLPALPFTPVGTIDQHDGRTWLTAPLPEPLEITGPVQQDQSVTVVFEVYECFRWQDEALPDYQDGVFDFEQTHYEPVMSFGATGYRIELR